MSVVGGRIEHMIETLAGPGAGEIDDLTASDLLALGAGSQGGSRTGQRLISWPGRPVGRPPPAGVDPRRGRLHGPRLRARGAHRRRGCPLVAEFCLAELGTVLGISTTAAKKLVGHALELRHRLPRLWAQVQSGRVPAWRARSVAEVTIHSTPALTREAAAFVDAQVAAVAGRIGPAQLDRLVAETDQALSTSPRRIRPRIRRTATSTSTRATPRIHDDDVHFAGTMRLEAELDIADALDLDRALAHGAAVAEGARVRPSPWTSRRAKALGDLARTQTALDLAGAGADRAAGLPAAREVVLHAHFDATLDDLATVFGPTGRMEEGQRLVLLDQVKDWCGDSRTKVTVKPVIDLNADLSTPAYDVPDRIREQVILRDRTCVFPWCTRPARGCDIDHVVPYDHDADAEGRPQPGPTAERQPRRAVPVPPPPQDPHRLALPDDRARRLRVDQPARPPLPTRPHRHHRGRPRRATRSARHPATTPTMTPPHTPPPSGSGATGMSGSVGHDLAGHPKPDQERVGSGADVTGAEAAGQDVQSRVFRPVTTRDMRRRLDPWAPRHSLHVPLPTSCCTHSGTP